MKNYIVAIITALLLFACNHDACNQKTSGDTTMQKPPRCKTLLRFSIESGHQTIFDVAECVNTDGNKAVFVKGTASSKWTERVMLEK